MISSVNTVSGGPAVCPKLFALPFCPKCLPFGPKGLPFRPFCPKGLPFRSKGLLLRPKGLTVGFEWQVLNISHSRFQINVTIGGIHKLRVQKFGLF